jgi:heterodisulfide reductase subunit A-like polyferredoxin
LNSTFLLGDSTSIINDINNTLKMPSSTIYRLKHTQMGASLNELLDACTCLGTEALVEVHTVAELEKALELGATNIVATNWDRIENVLYPNQAKGLKGLIPDLIVAIGAGGVGTVQDAAELADMGYDAAVLGRGLAASADIERLISTIRSRESLPNLLTGAGMMAEELKRGEGD